MLLFSQLISKCLRLFDTSSSSSSFEGQFRSNLIKSKSFKSGALTKLGLHGFNGPDRPSGVLCLIGDVLIIGVGHRDVFELTIGVVSVPTSLLLSSLHGTI